MSMPQPRWVIERGGGNQRLLMAAEFHQVIGKRVQVINGFAGQMSRSDRFLFPFHRFRQIPLFPGRDEQVGRIVRNIQQVRSFAGCPGGCDDLRRRLLLQPPDRRRRGFPEMGIAPAASGAATSALEQPERRRRPLRLSASARPCASGWRKRTEMRK